MQPPVKFFSSRKTQAMLIIGLLLLAAGCYRGTSLTPADPTKMAQALQTQLAQATQQASVSISTLDAFYATATAGVQHQTATPVPTRAVISPAVYDSQTGRIFGLDPYFLFVIITAYLVFFPLTTYNINFYNKRGNVDLAVKVGLVFPNISYIRGTYMWLSAMKRDGEPLSAWTLIDPRSILDRFSGKCFAAGFFILRYLILCLWFGRVLAFIPAWASGGNIWIYLAASVLTMFLTLFPMMGLTIIGQVFGWAWERGQGNKEDDIVFSGRDWGELWGIALLAWGWPLALLLSTVADLVGLPMFPTLAAAFALNLAALWLRFAAITGRSPLHGLLHLPYGLLRVLFRSPIRSIQLLRKKDTGFYLPDQSSLASLVGVAFSLMLVVGVATRTFPFTPGVLAAFPGLGIAFERLPLDRWLPNLTEFMTLPFLGSLHSIPSPELLTKPLISWLPGSLTWGDLFANYPGLLIGMAALVSGLLLTWGIVALFHAVWFVSNTEFSVKDAYHNYASYGLHTAANLAALVFWRGLLRSVLFTDLPTEFVTFFDMLVVLAALYSLYMPLAFAARHHIILVKWRLTSTMSLLYLPFSLPITMLTPILLGIGLIFSMMLVTGLVTLIISPDLLRSPPLPGMLVPITARFSAASVIHPFLNPGFINLIISAWFCYLWYMVGFRVFENAAYGSQGQKQYSLKMMFVLLSVPFLSNLLVHFLFALVPSDWIARNVLPWRLAAVNLFWATCQIGGLFLMARIFDFKGLYQSLVAASLLKQSQPEAARVRMAIACLLWPVSIPNSHRQGNIILNSVLPEKIAGGIREFIQLFHWEKKPVRASVAWLFIDTIFLIVVWARFPSILSLTGGVWGSGLGFTESSGILLVPFYNFFLCHAAVAFWAGPFIFYWLSARPLDVPKSTQRIIQETVKILYFRLVAVLLALHSGSSAAFIVIANASHYVQVTFPPLHQLAFYVYSLVPAVFFFVSGLVCMQTARNTLSGLNQRFPPVHSELDPSTSSQPSRPGHWYKRFLPGSSSENLLKNGLRFQFTSVLLGMLVLPVGQILNETAGGQGLTLEVVYNHWLMRFSLLLAAGLLLAALNTSRFFLPIHTIEQNILRLFAIVPLLRKMIAHKPHRRYFRALHPGYRRMLTVLFGGFVYAGGLAAMVIRPLEALGPWPGAQIQSLLPSIEMAAAAVGGIFLASRRVRCLALLSGLAALLSFLLLKSLHPLWFVLPAAFAGFVLLSNAPSSELPLSTLWDLIKLFTKRIANWHICETFSRLEPGVYPAPNRTSAELEIELVETIRHAASLGWGRQYEFWDKNKEEPLLQVLRLYLLLWPEKTHLVIHRLMFDHKLNEKEFDHATWNYIQQILLALALKTPTTSIETALDTLVRARSSLFDLLFDPAVQASQTYLQRLSLYSDLKWRRLPVPVQLTWIQHTAPSSESTTSTQRSSFRGMMDLLTAGVLDNKEDRGSTPSQSMDALIDHYISGRYADVINLLKPYEDQIPAAEELLRSVNFIRGIQGAKTTVDIAELANQSARWQTRPFTHMADMNAPVQQICEIIETIAQAQTLARPDRIPLYLNAVSQLARARAGLEATIHQPERSQMAPVFNTWQAILTEGLSEIGAPTPQIEIFLENGQVIWDTQQDLVFVIQNSGEGAAYNVDLEILPGENYRVLSNSRTNIERINGGQTFRTQMLAEFAAEQPTTLQARFSYLDQGKLREFPEQTFQVSFTRPADLLDISGMINPYVAGDSIKDPSRFFGRQDLLKQIKDILRSRDRANVIMLYGQRRMGKTSLLRMIESEYCAEGGLWPVFIDFQLFTASGKEMQGSSRDSNSLAQTSGAVSLIYSLAKSLRARLPVPEEVPTPDLADYLDNPGLALVKGFMPRVEYSLRQKDLDLLLMMDEFDWLYDETRFSQRDILEILGIIRGLAQDRRSGGIIYAGAHKLIQMSREINSPLFNHARPVHVSFMDEESAEDLIRRSTHGMLEYDQGAVNRIKRLSGNHPYYIQLICSSIFEAAREDNRTYVNVLHVNESVRLAQNEGRVNLEFLFNGNNGLQKLALSAAAGAIQYEGESVSVQQVFRDLSPYYPVKTIHIEKSMHEMAETEILRQVEDQYQFNVDLFRLWLKKTMPFSYVRSVVKFSASDVAKIMEETS